VWSSTDRGLPDIEDPELVDLRSPGADQFEVERVFQIGLEAVCVVETDAEAHLVVVVDGIPAGLHRDADPPGPDAFDRRQKAIAVLDQTLGVTR
jgi:hypothetical protein